MKLKRLAVSKVQRFNQITVVKEAVDLLGGLEKGDVIGFYEVENSPGIVVISKVSYVMAKDDLSIIQN